MTKIPISWLSHAGEVAEQAEHPTWIMLTASSLVVTSRSRARDPRGEATAAEEIHLKDLSQATLSPLPGAIQRVNQLVTARLAKRD